MNTEVDQLTIDIFCLSENIVLSHPWYGAYNRDVRVAVY
jgi:hypothetical protein